MIELLDERKHTVYDREILWSKDLSKSRELSGI